MWLVVLSGVVLPVLQTWVLIRGMPGLGLADILNYFLSIGAFYWLTTNIALAAKVPWAQRILPYDARVKGHIMTSIGVFVAVAYHAVYKFASATAIGLWAWLLVGILGGMLTASVLWVPLPGLARIRGAVLGALSRLGAMSYDVNKLLHRIFVWALIAVVPLHLADGSFLGQLPWFSVAAYFVPWAGVLALFWVSHTGIVLKRAAVTRLTVTGTRIQLGLSRPKGFRYRSGQFTFIDGHPFSFLSAPGEPELRFDIRLRGPFTRTLSRLALGDVVRIGGAFGSFRTGQEPASCLVAAGVGVVPMVSLLKEMHRRNEQRELLAIFSIAQGEEIPDEEWLRRHVPQWPLVRLLVVDGQTPDTRFSGEFFRREIDRPEGFRYYVCASPRVRQEIVQGLWAVGVGSRQILYEDFSLGYTRRARSDF